MENLCGSMSHISLGETARNFQQRPMPSHNVTRLSRASKPYPQMARDHSSLRTPLPAREPSVPLPRATEPRMSGSGRTYVAPTSYRHEPVLSAARAPRYRRPEKKKKLDPLNCKSCAKLLMDRVILTITQKGSGKFSMPKMWKMCTLWCRALD